MTVPVDLQQLPEIKLQSPLAIMGAFLYLIRNRFAEGSNLNWVWRDDPVASDITIEAQSNVNTENRDKRPGLYLDRTENTYGKVSIGNQDQNQHDTLAKDYMRYFSVGQMDVTIDCVSPVRGESMQLADIVHSYLESSKYVIMGVFNFRDFSPIVASRTSVGAKQTDLHVTTLSFRVEYETTWATVPVVATLRAIGLQLQEQRVPTDQFFREIYLAAHD